MLTNNRHELYCRNRAAGYSMTESARRSGHPEASAHNVGSRLERRQDVQRRIRELAATISPNALASKQWLVCELLENHRLARKDKNITASKQCLELVARLQGYLVERRESYSESLRLSVSNPTDLRKALTQQLGQLPESDRLTIAEPEPGVIDVIAESPTPEECTDNA